MIARPKISRNERKTTEIGASKVGNFAPFSCPGGRRDWARAARAGGAWTAPWLGPPPDEAMTRALLGGFEAVATPGPEVATPPGSPRPRGKGGGPPPASPATPHTAAMTAPLAPSVRTHDYPSDFLEKWAEAAGCRAVADKLPPHAMPVGAAQISACLEHLAPLAPRLRQVVAVPAWDGKRIIGYALLHGLPPASALRSRAAATPPPLALPPPAERGESASSGAASPAPDSDDDVGFSRAPATPAKASRASLDSRARAIRAALGAAGATKSSLDLALPLDDGTARDLCDGVGPALRRASPRPAESPRRPSRRSRGRRRAADGAAGRATSASDLALFDAGLRAPLEALVSTLYLASVKDANPLHAIELLASAARQGRRTLLPWSGEWADPQAVGNGGDDDPCEAMAEEMGLDILDVAGAVHRGREFVEPVLELGLGSAGNGLFRALALFGAELVAQCSAAADRVDAAAALRARGGAAAVRKLSKLLAAARGGAGAPGGGAPRGRRAPPAAEAAAPAPAPADDDPADDPGDADESVDAEAAVEAAADDDGVVDEDRVAVEDGAPEDDDDDEEEDDDDDDDDEARVLGGLGGSAEDDDDDDLDDDMDDLDDMDDPDGLDDDDESFAALAETLLARALLGRDKYAPKALMRAASMAAEVLAARGMPLPPLPLLAGYAARLASASAQRDVEGVERALSRSAARDGAPQGRVLPVVLVLAFEESVYVVLEARHDALLELSSPETLEACGPRGRSRSDSGADRDRVVIGSECWTGGGFGHVEVMMQLPQPLRLACDRSLLHHALLQLPPADAADDCTPWLTLALLPGADDLVAVPLAGLYVRTAAAGGLGAFGGGLALGDDAGAPPPLAAALVGDGVSEGRPSPGGADDDEASARVAPEAAAPEEPEVDDDDGGPWRDEDDEDAPPWALADADDAAQAAPPGRAWAEARAAYVAAAARVGEQADSAARDAGRARDAAADAADAPAPAPAAPEARATALEASDDDEESDEPERRATVSSVLRGATSLC